MRDAAAIRVTSYLYTPRWWSWVCRYAGPVTRADLRANGCEPVVPRLAEYSGYLADRFPEYRQAIDDTVGSEPVDRRVANVLTRDVLSAVLRSAVESADDQLLWSWYRTAEELLASPDEDLRDAVLHEPPGAAWEPATHTAVSRQRAGSLLARAIDEYYRDGTWRSDTDWRAAWFPKGRGAEVVRRAIWVNGC
ncbi:hypothetical protein [Kribbella ginsengisoli]|uniref:Uncharacterized protein n=1 Tax=Kribbella ginsengisoli TaxID=363865 RepID=A0ABP6VY04_9ACTN